MGVDEISEKGVSGYKVSTNARDAIIEIKRRAVAKEFDILLVFIRSIETGINRNNIYDGVIATCTAFAGEISMKEHRIVLMSEISID